ncbi:MAG TPA: FAD-binding oxidoreductase [Acidimicrobiales bacterium]|nr:FAD-binding oxidoreductase [Acidimicrobiales bacterium]
MSSLTGWGRTQPSVATVVTPANEHDVLDIFARATKGVIARGLGRSYGDAAQVAGGTVIDGLGLGGIGPIDEATGEVTVGAGTSLDSLLATSVPKGWFIAVSPGTRQVTIGGAIAADVHGKNHHRDGAFCEHVRSLRLVTPTGAMTVSPTSDPDVFWGTAGALGLTGMVTEATLRLLPIETDRVVVDTDRCKDLDALMAAMATGEEEHRYSVAWVDCMATGARLGRAVLTRGDHAPRAHLDATEQVRERAPSSSGLLRVPWVAPKGLLNRASIRAFNEAWFRRAPRHRRGELVSLGAFFHPLDFVTDWNLLYGPRGVVQYQLAVPDTGGDTVRRAIELLATSGVPSFLAVLKRFGPSDPGFLSFPIEGWTLALDMPVGPPQLPGILDQLDELVVADGGRVYLAKDARLDPRHLRAMYPRLDELASLRARLDPRGVLTSDLARRLGV